MPAPVASSDRPSRDGSRQPAGDLQESLEQDGISWEGAILIVGHDSDIPAWLTVTAERFVLSRGEVILLEAPRSWLVPPPLRVHDQQVRVSITPEGVVPGRETTERLLLDVEKGRGPAQQLVAILTRRSRREQFNAEFPSWSTGVGAGPSLPPLPAFEASQDTDAPRGRHPVTSERRGAEPTDAWGPGEASTRASKPLIPFPAPEEEPVEPQSHAARYLAGREHGPALPEEPATAHEERPAKVTSIEDERERRGAGWGIWAGRVAMVLIVAMVGAWFLQDYLPDEVTERLPALIGDPGDIAPDAGDEQPRSSDAERGDGTLGAGTDPEDVMPTEAALGIGGTTSEVPDPALETETEPADTSDDTPTPTSEPETAPQESARPNESTDAGNPAAIIFPPDGTGNSQPPDDTTGDEALGAAEDADGGLEQLAPTFTPGPTATEVPAEPTDTPTATVAATDVPAGPTVAPEPTETQVPTTKPTATVTSEPEQTPTATATHEPESTSTPEPTQTETPTPTETPSVIPELAEETTEQVVAETTPEPVLTSQPPSVTEEDPPTQQFASEGIRYSIEGATTGTSLPELPEINEVTYGEWIVLAVEGENWTDSEQIFDMREFTLIADGQPIQLDVGNSWVASLLGYTPAYGNTSATLWAPGEEHPLVLTFLAPLDAESLVLQAGDQQFDLRTILERTPRLSEMRQGEVPEAIEATVTEVIDGETIVIEKDGVEQTVRYLGIDAPDGDDCYAEASGALNRELVEGRTVRIERQATDVDARGNWVRDVWVEQDDGRFALVAHQLVEAGAARADISEPNTRFASWLRGAEAVAQAENRGLWGNCEQGSVSTSVTADVVIAADHRRTA